MLGDLDLGLTKSHDDRDSYLALCLSEQEQWQSATEAAQRAISLDPAGSYHHYALAHVYSPAAPRRKYRASPATGDRTEMAPMRGTHTCRAVFRKSADSAIRVALVQEPNDIL